MFCTIGLTQPGYYTIGPTRMQNRERANGKRIAETLKGKKQMRLELNKYDGTKYIHRKTDLLDDCV